MPLFGQKLLLTVVVFLLTEPRSILGGCNGFTTTIDLRDTSSGTIQSPGYPNNYEDNKDCSWFIKAPPGQKVLIYFTEFDLEESSLCSYDSVNILNEYHISLSKSCGSGLPSPVYSSSRFMYIKFTSDGSASGKGFVAHYRALSNSSDCPSVVPGASAGVIYSPNFPWNYPKDIRCDWAIRVPRQRSMELSFTRFDLKPSSWSGYCSDFVLVQNKNYRQKGKYCGSLKPSPITFYSGDTIRVRFYSDFSTKYYSGFMAFYNLTGHRFPTTSAPYPYWTTSPRVYSPSLQSIYTCYPGFQTILSVTSSSSISIASSPDIDGVSPTSLPLSRCTFKIDTADGYILELSFDQMSISACSGCSCGYVKVRDGTTSAAQLLGTFCSGNHPDVVKSKGNHMFVEYYAVRRQDTFKATVSSKKGTPVNVAGIVVPLVIAVVLFTIIIVVIKCTKIKRSSEPAAQSRGVPLQTLPLSVELPPTTQSLTSNTEVDPQPVNAWLASPETSQLSILNREVVPPPYSESFATQGVTNMSQEEGSAQL